MSSQCGQTEFVIEYFSGAAQLSYLEIGAQHPVILNNTFELESKYDWDGVSLELLDNWKSEWTELRKNTLIVADALRFDFASLGQTHFNYLSCDINPPKNTFAALKKMVECGLTFDVITFEHDYYTGVDMDVRGESRSFLQSHGYTLERSDVEADFQKAINWLLNSGLNADHAKELGCAPFEDWYVRAS